MASMIKNGMDKEPEVRNDGGGGSRTVCNVEQVQTHGQFAKVVVLCKIGEGSCKKDRGTALSDFVSTRGAEDEATKGSLQYVWEEASNNKNVAQGFRSLG